MTRKTIEFRKMMGGRMMDSDGFTYVYGKAKGGCGDAPPANDRVKRCIRHDKRSVKAKELRRVFQEYNEEIN